MITLKAIELHQENWLSLYSEYSLRRWSPCGFLFCFVVFHFLKQNKPTKAKRQKECKRRNKAKQRTCRLCHGIIALYNIGSAVLLVQQQRCNDTKSLTLCSIALWIPLPLKKLDSILFCSACQFFSPSVFCACEEI